MGKNIGVIPICSHCETGRKDYELDRKSLFCSHISCLKNGKCDKYEPVIQNSFKFKKLRNDIIIAVNSRR